MKVSISIIIPCYNVELYLKECLDSIINQSFTDFEAICINDGSTDSTLSILKEYELKDHRIKVFTQSNKGLSATRNEALNKAAGKYVCFVDSDDKLLPGALEKMFSISESKNLDLLRFENKIQYDDEKFKNRCRKQVPLDTYEVMDGKELFLKLLNNNDMPVYAWKFFLKLENLKKDGFKFPVGLIYEDTFSCPVFYFISKRAYIIRDLLYCYRRRIGSITENHDKKQFIQSKFLALIKLSKYPEKYGLTLTQTKQFNEFILERRKVLFNFLMENELYLDYLWDYVQQSGTYEAVHWYSLIIQDPLQREKANKILSLNFTNRFFVCVKKVILKVINHCKKKFDKEY